MATTLNAVKDDKREGNSTLADNNATAKQAADSRHDEHAKVQEKVAEKRRALGRGLASLLPGPRVVPVPAAKPEDRAGGVELQAVGEASHPVADAAGSAGPSGSPAESGRAGMPVTPAASHLGQPGATAAPLVSAAPSIVKPLSGDEVMRIELDLIDENPHQTRTEFDEAALKELADSIRVQGVLQPIVVRPGADGHYRLILGERRLRASRIAGMETIPAIIKRVSEQQAAEMTLVENLQRQDLNCVEQAEAFANLSKEFHLTQEQIGARVGVARETVANYMRLLTLPESVLGALYKGRLTYSHARALMRLTDHTHIWSLAKKAMEEKLSVAKLEELVMAVTFPAGGGQQSGPSVARWVDPNVKAAQRKLEEILGMRVRIRDRNGRGRILIEYATIEDFDRVVKMLKGK